MHRPARSAFPADRSYARRGSGANPVSNRLAALYQPERDSCWFHVGRSTSRAEQSASGDVILWNERGEITESCSANVVIDLAGDLITPPIASGLLGGTFRGELVEHGQIAERVITIEMWRAARRVYLINSVRKWMDVALIDYA